MSEGNIMPDFFSTADNRESVSITETIPKEKAKRGSYLSQNGKSFSLSIVIEEEINIISGRKLRSALLPNWSHRSPIPQVENIEDIQHSQI